MAKKKWCATCKTELTNKNYHQMWDSVRRQMVYVCADQHRCPKPYTRKVVTTG